MLFRELPKASSSSDSFSLPDAHKRWLILLFAAWVLPGLVGHDPWKPDEAYTFGVVFHYLQGGDWLVPMIAGEPFMEKPPLFSLVAALFAKLLSPLLPPHDGARLASGFFMALVFGFTARTGRELYGQDHGWISAVVLLGCLGLLVRTHQLIPDVALLAGFAIALYGLALCLRRPVAGGVWLGLGAGIGFMSKGLIAPGMLALVALLLPLLPAWRARGHALALLIACAVALPWLLVWPLSLYLKSSDLFEEWLWVNNFGRFFGFIKIGPGNEPFYYFKILPWFAWPAWPLAAWAVWVQWTQRGKAAALSAAPAYFSAPGMGLPLITFGVMLAVLTYSADAREVYALPMLLPLALLAGSGVGSLRRGAANALYWFSALGFTFFAGVFWFYWVALEFGIPAQLFRHLHEMQPGYAPGLRPIVFVIALAYSLAWGLLLWRLKRNSRHPERPVMLWSAGMALAWGMLMTLFVAWADTGKSYRQMMLSMQRSLPANHACVASRNLSEPQRAMLHYYSGIITRRAELETRPSKGAATASACKLLLVQGAAKAPAAAPGAGWKKIWQGARPGDDVERYWLYQRVN